MVEDGMSMSKLNICCGSMCPDGFCRHSLFIDFISSDSQLATICCRGCNAQSHQCDVRMVKVGKGRCLYGYTATATAPAIATAIATWPADT